MYSNNEHTVSVELKHKTRWSHLAGIGSVALLVVLGTQELASWQCFTWLLSFFFSFIFMGAILQVPSGDCSVQLGKSVTTGWHSHKSQFTFSSLFSRLSQAFRWDTTVQLQPLFLWQTFRSPSLTFSAWCHVMSARYAALKFSAGSPAMLGGLGKLATEFFLLLTSDRMMVADFRHKGNFNVPIERFMRASMICFYIMQKRARMIQLSVLQLVYQNTNFDLIKVNEPLFHFDLDLYLCKVVPLYNYCRIVISCIDETWSCHYRSVHLSMYHSLFSVANCQGCEAQFSTVLILRCVYLFYFIGQVINKDNRCWLCWWENKWLCCYCQPKVGLALLFEYTSKRFNKSLCDTNCQQTWIHTL